MDFFLAIYEVNPEGSSLCFHRSMDNSKTQEDQSHDQYAVRLQKLQNLREAGADPYSANCVQTHTSTQAKALYDELGVEETGETVSVAGRIVTFRVMGKATFDLAFLNIVHLNINRGWNNS